MFIKNLVTLFSGTAFAQVIPLVIAPLLTRLYTPGQFGVYGAFLAVIALTGVVSTLRYDFATAQAEDEKDAQRLLSATFLISLLVGVLLFIVAFVNSLFGFLQRLLPAEYLYLVAMSTVLYGVMQAYTYFLNRNGLFKVVAKLKVIQAIVASGVMLSLYSSPLNGLLIGHVAGQTVFLIYFIIKKERIILKLASFRKIVLKYRAYPEKALPGAIMNSFYLQLPVLFIKGKFDALYVGYFAFINRYIAGPLGILSMAIAQVLMKEVATESRSRIKKLFFRILISNTCIALAFILVIYLFGAWGIQLLLGEAWGGMYPYLLLLSVSVSIRFIVSPLSIILTKRENIHLAFRWQFASFIAMLLFISFGSFENSFLNFLRYFVIMDVIAYMLYTFTIFCGIKHIKAY